MKKIDKPIGIILAGPEDLFIPQNHSNVYYFVEKNSFEHHWIKKIVDQNKIIIFIYSDKISPKQKGIIDEIIKHSNITQLFKDNNIKHIGLPAINSKFLTIWSKKNNVEIIATPFSFQNKFEDKIWFDRFLTKHNIPKPNSIIYNYKKLNKKFNITKKMVLQKRDSWAGQGTYILENDTDIIKLLEKKIINEDEDYLLREFIEGKSYGITVFISSKKVALSAMRLQCFYNNPYYKNLYAGIQWVNNKNFTKNSQKKIHDIFSYLGKILYNMGFIGYANFDFILNNNNNVFLIECNPRIAGSTAQIVKFPELISGIDSGKILIDEILYPQKYDNFNLIKYNNNFLFEGSNLEINLFPELIGRPMKVKNIYQNGIYKYENDKATYLTPDIKKFNYDKKEFIFFSRIANHSEVTSSTHIETANIISSFPLFNSDGKLNKDGKRIFEIFNYKDNE